MAVLTQAARAACARLTIQLALLAGCRVWLGSLAGHRLLLHALTVTAKAGCSIQSCQRWTRSGLCLYAAEQTTQPAVSAPVSLRWMWQLVGQRPARARQQAEGRAPCTPRCFGNATQGRCNAAGMGRPCLKHVWKQCHAVRMPCGKHAKGSASWSLNRATHPAAGAGVSLTRFPVAHSSKVGCEAAALSLPVACALPLALPAWLARGCALGGLAGPCDGRLPPCTGSATRCCCQASTAHAQLAQSGCSLGAVWVQSELTLSQAHQDGH